MLGLDSLPVFFDRPPFPIAERLMDFEGEGAGWRADDDGADEQSSRRERWVLVVEDDRDCRESLEILLRTSGFGVRTAENGREALDILGAGAAPSVILLDNMMPKMTGEQFLEERRDDPRLSRIPVLMLSAWGISATGKPLDVDQYIPKPYDPEQIVSVVGRFLKR